MAMLIADVSLHIFEALQVRNEKLILTNDALSLRENNEVRIPSHGDGIHVLLSSMSMRNKASG